jgi:hypothetical protein
MTEPLAATPCHRCRFYRRALVAALAVLAITWWMTGQP